MCYPSTCKTCGRITWSGCGMHVAEVRAQVPTDRWCTGHDQAATRGWLRRLIGR